LQTFLFSVGYAGAEVVQLDPPRSNVLYQSINYVHM